MFDHKMPGIWMLLLLCIASVAPARADGPPAGFKRDADGTLISPDRKVRLEQYVKTTEDGDLIYQFWTFDRDRRRAFLLNPDEGDDPTGYAAGFHFSPNSQWLERMQKTGAGSQTLFLYRRKGYEFPPATAKPLGELAWDYFFTTPVSKGMHRDPQNPYALDHAFVGLVKGIEENYAWMGKHWPDSRYIVISLSFDMQGEATKAPWIEGWQCVYDLKSGAFSVLPDFAENNAKAIKPPEPQAK